MIGDRLKQLRKTKNKSSADLCNCNLNWLVAGEGEMFNTPTSNEEFRNSEMLTLIDEALKRHGLIK